MPDRFLPKPPHGAACNSCGRCCMAVLCPLGQHVFQRVRGPCPALMGRTDGPETGCGLAMQPLRYRPTLRDAEEASAAARYLIGAGVGCDAAVEGEPLNAEFREHLVRTADRTVVRMAAQVWGIPHA